MNQARNAGTSAATLQGDALHAFIEQAYELLHAHNDHAAISPEERKAAAVELMEQQNFAPASVPELERLHDFWLMLDRPDTANALLQAHRDTAEKAHEGDDQAMGSVSLSLSDIQSCLRFDQGRAVALLLPTAHKISQLPESVDAEVYWMGWESLTDACQAWDVAEHGVDLRRTQEKADPDNEGEQAYGDAMACVRKADLARQRGDSASISRQIQAAITTLSSADADQEADFDHWMLLAHRILELAPQSIPSLLMACEQYLARTEEPTPSQAVKAHRQVKIVRLQALACDQMGQREAALQLAPKGHFGLTDDPGDPFTERVLYWLMEAGKLDELAPLALESVVHARSGSGLAAYKIALELIDKDLAHGNTWALILAISQIDEDMRQMLASEPRPPLPANDYLERVRASEPHHTILALTEGMRYSVKRQHEKALPLLEQSVGLHPEIADSDKLPALWAARFAVLPLEEALARPFPHAHGGHWCYAAGVVLDDADDLAPLMGGKKKVPEEEVREPLVVRYYEEGLARFEAFWATGQGEFKDADLHVYSMLCNNLAIKYRFLDRYDEAAALHHSGLASSPFAEHQSGLLWCAIGKEDNPAIVAEAERLWHFAQEHGYGRHDPPNYFPAVAVALYELDRTAEISIWLERLDEWFESLDEDEQKEERRDYLAAMMSLLDFFSTAHPELVLPRLRANLPEVRALKESYTLRRVACAMETSGATLEEALALHHESAANLDKNEDDESEFRMSREGIERVERKIAEARGETESGHSSASKPWWKFW